MPTTIQITTDNYDGQTAVITFTPDNGGPVVNLGSQVLPYDYNSDYYYGTYSLYFPAFNVTCTLVIAGQTPTPTPTITPTITPTMTPTPSPTQPKQYYVYKSCDTDYYIIQTLPVPPINGVSLNPNNAFKFGDDIDGYFCYEYLYVTTNPNPFPPGTNYNFINGNHFTTVLNTVFDNCNSCVSPAGCYSVTFHGTNDCGLGGHYAFTYTDCEGNVQIKSVPFSFGTVCVLFGPTVVQSPEIICGTGTITIGGPCVEVCYRLVGLYTQPDPQHPNGGSISYYDNLNVLHTVNGIWSDSNVTINATSIVSSTGIERYLC